MSNPIVVIQNRGAGDRLGAQLTWYICQLIHAHFLGHVIEYEEQLFPRSIYTLTLKQFIDEHYNKNLSVPIAGQRQSIVSSENWCAFHHHTVNMIKSDLVRYFRDHMSSSLLGSILDEHALAKGYRLPFHPGNTILVHLRLDDVNFENRVDYNGSHSFNYYVNKVNQSDLDYSDEGQYYKDCGVVTDNYNLYNCQAPMSDTKIQDVIYRARTCTEYKDHDVVIITSPIGEVTLPYRTIRSDDPSLDLYYLCRGESALILSRSTFALTTLYFTKATDVWVPKWGYLASMGLGTRFQKETTTRFHLF